MPEDIEMKTGGKAEDPMEGDAFLKNGQPLASKEPAPSPGGIVNCCRSKHTSRCCIATSVIGLIFIILGVVVMIIGSSMLEKFIYKSMALKPGTDRTDKWLNPPVQPHLTAYAFHITNPEAVLQGKKPILEEKGPFVYKAVTIRDSDDNMRWSDDQTLLTYRPRKVYSYVPELSAEGFKDPNQAFITVPNIPFWTGLKKAAGNTLGLNLVTSNGGVVPFVNVSINGLLWGTTMSELPCLNLNVPEECKAAQAEAAVKFSDSDSDFDDFPDDSGGFDNEPKAEAPKSKNDPKKEVEVKKVEEEVPDFKIPEKSHWQKFVKPSAEFVNCKCEWGLFRDRNVTLREPVTFYTGVSDLRQKGWVEKYNKKKYLGWWKKDSICDKVKGQDASTLYPGLSKDDELDIFIDLMCRTIKLKYELTNEYSGIKTLRYIPAANALGSADDPDPERRNPDNDCYCMKSEGFPCYKSGLLNMGPCKRSTNPPLALSMPHFYQADPSYLEAVSGLKPNKEKHQFFMDVVPEFGFPLAIRPRFQLNLVLFREPGLKELKNLPEQLVIPFMWAEDGFGEPSEDMVNQIKFGLEAPNKVPKLVAILCFVIGGASILGVLVYFLWRKRDTVGSKDIS